MTTYRLSPSAAARWIACPGSEYIVRQLPRLPSTPAAEEGTLAHAFAAWTLAGTILDVTGEGPANGMPPEPEHALATEDILNAAQVYADAVLAKVAEQGDPAEFCLSVEDRVQFSAEGADILGRADFTAVSRDALIVVDFKFGGEPVPVAGNPQLLCYALAIARTYTLYPDRVILGIVQPRSAGTDFADYGAVWAEYSGEEFAAMTDQIVDAARTACTADDRTPRATGTHCRYCPARSVCRAAIGERLLLAAIAAGEAQMAQDATNEQIGAWLTALKEIDTARDDLVRIAKARIGNGETVPGWRVQSRRTQYWTSEIADMSVREAADILAERLDARAEDFIDVSLRSPAKVAKTLPKDALSSVTETAVTTALVKNGGVTC